LPAGEPVAPATIYARCLGGFAIYRGDLELNIGKSRAAQEICRYLIAHAGRRVSSEDLIELVWPNADAELAAHRLHVAVSTLRHALESAGARPSLIHFDEGAYFISSNDVVTDCDLFNRWYDAAKAHIHRGDMTSATSAFKKALALYQGDYFSDIPYAEWTHDARAHYIERRLSALTFLCEHAERAGDFLEVAECARAILSIDDLREIAHRHLMRAHYHLGQRGVAIRQFRICCELLEKELGVTPSRLTRALYEAIRDDNQLPADSAHLT
jgi:DNA-binding SARP family transcriptional activator